MLDWLKHRSLADVLAFAGVVVTLAVALTGPTRRWCGRMARAGMVRFGRPERKYAAWFIAKWGQYENPYLADTENLDLSSTFVSLSFQAVEPGDETRRIATKVLADRAVGNLIIEGAPGSGKSTLLKAYGVGVLKARQRGLSLRRQPTDIPFFVQLRKYARHLGQGGGTGMASYIVDEILVSGAGMDPTDAADFFRHVLTEGRALVMLDGLDEVTADRYAAVLESVHRFGNDRHPQRPTQRARIIVTCRQQNFLSIRGEWTPVIARRVCTLAPLRNSEMFNYLNKLRSKFRSPDGPESFFQAVRASGTLDLHRVPLILAMSVGLYARKDFYEVPTSIAKLYQTMIEEMLDRQRFKRDPGGSALVFQVDDKYRFLREFSVQQAVGADGFNDFGRQDLLAVARVLAPRLNAVADPVALVREIIDRSGLLTDVSETGRFVFAHRSIHEHLVAEELRLTDDGAVVLLTRAEDPEWRQVILFYTAALEQRTIDAFLPQLAERNLTLAAHCLAGAKASDDVARAVLDELRPNINLHMTAMIAATMSPRQPVQEMSIARLERALEVGVAAGGSFEAEVDGMLPLLGSLAGSNAARIAALVPMVVAGIPDDPRLVEPLWRCLAAPGIETQPACSAIVGRLLGIAMDVDGMEELEKQERYTRPFLTGTVRQHAYPFADGLPQAANLVTLLAWAEYLKTTPAVTNRYFEAKQADRLTRLERDKRRTISFSLLVPARVISGTATILSFVLAVRLLITNPEALLRPLGWWTTLLSLALGGVAFLAYGGLNMLADWQRAPSWIRQFLGGRQETSNGHIASTVPNFHSKVLFTSVAALLVFGGPVSFIVATTPLMASTPIPFYVAVEILGPLICFWLPIVDGFTGQMRYHLYRPNPYVDAYDDPRSRHWLVPSITSSPTTE